MDNNDSVKKYCNESRDYAIQQALQRCIFELKIRDKLFNGDNYTFKDFVNDIYYPYKYTKKELKMIYCKSKEIIRLFDKNH